MNREEFIKLSVGTGYADKKVSTEYAQGKETFTDKDFIAVHRLYEIRKKLERSWDIDEFKERTR